MAGLKTIAAAALGAGAQIVLAHHDADPSAELPVWLLVAVVALVALVWLAAWRIRRRRRRR